MLDLKLSDIAEVSSRPPRTIVLCFDGTNGRYDSMSSNVVKFFGLLHKDSPEQQVTYYQAGIGTYFAPGIVSPLWTWLASLLDDAFAWYLDVHVMDGYKYLMNNYRPGDKICLFGFSRGAYTARALAGMLHKVGLLPRDNLQQVNFAYKAYNWTTKEGKELASGFKQTFSQDVRVEFVGVWDTVESTGVLVNRQLPFTDSNTTIKVFRHALSLDEHRSRYRPNPYHWPIQDEPLGKATATEILTGRLLLSYLKRRFTGKRSCTVDSGPFANLAEQNKPLDGAAIGKERVRTPFETESATGDTVRCTDVLEVWFAGCHRDIGGGNVKDNVRVSLAQISLHWMVQQVIQSQCGILFDSAALARIGFTASLPFPPSGAETAGNNHNVGQPALNIQDFPGLADALAPSFDALKINKLWWLLEIIPFSYAWQDDDGRWHTKWSINLGRGRFIPSKEPKFHHTVKTRVDYEPLEYTPRAVYYHQAVYV